MALGNTISEDLLEDNLYVNTLSNIEALRHKHKVLIGVLQRCARYDDLVGGGLGELGILIDDFFPKRAGQEEGQFFVIQC